MLSYIKYSDIYYDELISMITDLYDLGYGEVVDTTKINRTINESKHNQTVNIILIKKDDCIIGYSIIILFWSNEFGGNILNIDEIYFKQQFRRRGFGSEFINEVEELFKDCVGIQLEVDPANINAQNFYQAVGLLPYHNLVLFKQRSGIDIINY